MAAPRDVNWDETYRLHAAGLQRYIRRLSRDGDEAADIVQETFVKAMTARNVPSEDGATGAWLYRIATNVLISRHRRRQRLAFLLTSRRSVPVDNSHDAEAEQVRQALRAIPAEQAITLVLRLHEGRPRAEIAALLGISEEAVRSRLRRGRENFAAAFERLESGPLP
jgi:RNA polymerase sigma-70 factor (ECF subfamily)